MMKRGDTLNMIQWTKEKIDNARSIDEKQKYQDELDNLYLQLKIILFSLFQIAVYR